MSLLLFCHSLCNPNFDSRPVDVAFMVDIVAEYYLKLFFTYRDSPGGKGGRCVRLTTYHPCSAERQEIRSLNLPGPPWVISTPCCGRDLYLYLFFIFRRQCDVSSCYCSATHCAVLISIPGQSMWDLW